MLFGNLINHLLGFWLHWSSLTRYSYKERKSPPSGKGAAKSSTSAKSNVCLLFIFQKHCFYLCFLSKICPGSGHYWLWIWPQESLLLLPTTPCDWTWSVSALGCAAVWSNVIGRVWNHSSPPYVNSSGSRDIQTPKGLDLHVCRLALWWMCYTWLIWYLWWTFEYMLLSPVIILHKRIV